MHTGKHHLAAALLALTLLVAAGCGGPTVTDQDKRKEAGQTAAIVAPPRVERPVLADQAPALEPAVPGRQENLATKEEAAAPPSGKSKALTPAVLSTSMPRTAAVPQAGMILPAPADIMYGRPPLEQESYNAVADSPLVVARLDPLSTFSIDVDTASYGNVRRFLAGGRLPPAGAVRIEEMINYFSYDYPQPGAEPIAIAAEVGPSPWQPGNKLIRIGLKAKDLAKQDVPPSNLVFLIDVSGSMAQPNKLPLLQQSMLMLVEQMSARDRIAIVVYAGSDRVVLPPTPGDRTVEIKAAIMGLTSGGSTHASSGIVTAYQLARQSFMPKCNNRVILASDGDFNVGVTSRDELERLIARERESGVFLTVLGFGMGNYHDDTMEILADKGNGNYSYIDTLLEARKVLVKERVSTLFTLARDVKIQVEFNPARVGAYRLIGYENRQLADTDFHDDKKDAGEIGVGHTVTALYEIYPPGSPAIPKIDELKYGQPQPTGNASGELLTVKLRYKPQGEAESRLMSTAVADRDIGLGETGDDFRFAAAVAGFGMRLKEQEPPAGLTYPLLLELAKKSRGRDEEGYRAEFIRLLETAELLEAGNGRKPLPGKG